MTEVREAQENRVRRYVIPALTRLIIVDAHDTVLKRDLSREAERPFVDPRGRETIEWVLRDGLLNFLDYFVEGRGKLVVVSSDGNASKLHDILERFGAARRITRIYGREHLDPETYLKRLDRILADTGVNAEQAVFIGDGKIDGLSATRFGVPFIQVPGTLEDPSFSFNAFVEKDPADPHGLRLQRIANPRRVFYNSSTPELVELIVSRQEGQLAHLGPIICATGAPAAASASEELPEIELLVVREPSSEQRIHSSSPYRFAEPEMFRTIHLRLLAFLQDRELFVQDCYVSAQPGRRMPLRIVAERATHALFARHNFIQMQPSEEASFVPEFVLIHAPTFRAIPELDGTAGPAFTMLHPARKLVLVGGTEESSELRRSIYDLISFFLAQADILPIHAATGALPDERSLLVLGRDPFARINTILGTTAELVGEAHHGWTEAGIFNLEWGCRVPLGPVDRRSAPELYESLRRFAVLIEGAELDVHRKLRRKTDSDFQGEAFFPIPHVSGARRSGIAGPPGLVLLLIEDRSGRLPPVSRLTIPQLTALYLLGWEDTGTPQRTAACFGCSPGLFDPVVYTLAFYQKLVASGARCFLLNGARLKKPGDHPLVRLRNTAASLVDGTNPDCGGLIPTEDAALIDLFAQWTEQLREIGGMLEPEIADAFLPEDEGKRGARAGH